MKRNEYEIEHAAVVRRLAPECTVLLKRDGSFPLSAPGKLALYGSGARHTVKGGILLSDSETRDILLAEAGCNAYRFGIEWARIEPEEGGLDEGEIEHYRRVLDCCRENGVTPIVTLMHFTSSAWLITKGGWGTAKVAEYFARYARCVAERLGDRLPYICTINEANMGIQLHKVIRDMMKAGKRKEGGAAGDQRSPARGQGRPDALAL